MPYRVLGLLAAVLLAGCGNSTPPPPDDAPDSPPPTDTHATDNARRAPDFTVSMLGGETVRLRDLAGKPVVVHFWGTWCYWCKKESLIIDRMYQTYHPKGIEFVPISVGDKPQQVTDYLKKHRLHWPSALDPRGMIAAKYKIRGYPTTILVDRSGNIAKTHVGMANEKTWTEMMEALLAKE